MKIQGIFAALTTPFHSNGAVARDDLRENISRYNKTRLAGYVVNGSTGESVLLEWGEVERVWETVRDAAAPEKLLIAGTGAESTELTIRQTNRAAELGYRAALVRTPHYYKPQMADEALAAYFLRVADESRIPILLYSIPAFTGIALEVGLVEKLSRHPNICGIKDSSGDVAQAAEMIAVAPVGFATLVGSASTLFASIAVGATGAILALAAVFPELCAELYEASQDGHESRAETIQQILHGASKLMGRLGVPGIKYALDLRGYRGGAPRLPLLPLNAAQCREVEATFAQVLVEMTPVRN
jgi:4-hydroxy-2-oxoglutarate aldolase